MKLSWESIRMNMGNWLHAKNMKFDFKIKKKKELYQFTF